MRINCINTTDRKLSVLFLRIQIKSNRTVNECCSITRRVKTGRKRGNRMIIVISAIVLIGFGITLLLLCRNDILSDWNWGLIGTMFSVVGIMFFIVFGGGYISTRLRIEQDIRDKTIERLGIEQNYIESLKTSDKHRQISAIAKIATWNDDVSHFKKMSKNPIIGDFYPKEVAETLQYIDLESEDLCTD